MQKGYVQVYTGNGKGKSTAAFGLCLRFLGAKERSTSGGGADEGDRKVFIGQFMKKGGFSETRLLRQLSAVCLMQYGSGTFVSGFSQQERDLALSGLMEACEKLKSNGYQMVILDEICAALEFKLLTREEVEELISQKPETTELILTGRAAPPWLIERADLVTEMRELKHYYAQGVPARLGIEF